MKLTTKLVLVFLLGMLCVQSINAYWLMRRENERFEQEMMQRADQLRDSMKEQLGSSPDFLPERVGQLSPTVSDERVRIVFLRNWPDKQYQPSVPVESLRITIGQRTSIAHIDEQGGRLYAYSPVGDMDGKPAYVELTCPLSEAEQYNRSTLYQHLAVAAATLLVGFGVVLLGVKLVGNRLRLLIDKTNRIAGGDFSRPLKLSGNDELSQLGVALNDMCEALASSQEKVRAESTARVAAVEQLRHADRLNTVGRLASGVAHEMGTPLNVVSGRAELIASGRLSEEEVRGSARIIKAETDRITRIIRQLLDFARRRTPQRSVVDLRDVVQQTIDLIQPMAEKQQVSISLESDDQPLRARVDVGQIQQVLTNLTVNAIQGMPDGGSVTLKAGTAEAACADDPDGSSQACYYISVADNGQGIADEDLPYIFEPFFTTKDIGEGTGLGLSVSYGIVHDHGGWIDVDSTPGEGSCFTVYLPQEANQCPDAS